MHAILFLYPALEKNDYLYGFARSQSPRAFLDLTQWLAHYHTHYNPYSLWWFWLNWQFSMTRGHQNGQKYGYTRHLKSETIITGKAGRKRYRVKYSIGIGTTLSLLVLVLSYSDTVYTQKMRCIIAWDEQFWRTLLTRSIWMWSDQACVNRHCTSTNKAAALSVEDNPKKSPRKERRRSRWKKETLPSEEGLKKIKIGKRSQHHKLTLTQYV